MPITRSILFGALAALGIPTILKFLGGSAGGFIYTISTTFTVADIHFRWSTPIFFAVTAFTFILLLITRNR